MQASEDIQRFIQKCIRASRITISIVSNESLLSGWVGMETIYTFYFEKFSDKRKFIACYLDEDFFALDFTSNAVRRFDEQLNALKSLMDNHNTLGIDTRDLNENKTRLLFLRSHLDEIIQRLRNSLCVNIKGDHLKNNFPSVLKSISEKI